MRNNFANGVSTSQVRRDVDGVLQTEDIIPNKESLIVYSSKGYIKRMTPDLFSTQVPFPFPTLLSAQH